MDIRDLSLEYFENMLRARKGYGRIMDPICQQWDLTRNEMDVILFLYNNPGFDRASDVAIHRGMAKSHVSLSVADLESKGLLRRNPDPEDRRTVHLELIGDARDIAAQGQQAQRTFFGKLYSGLTPEDMAAWARVVSRVIDNISHME